MTMIKQYLLCLLLAVCSIIASANTIRVSGTVTNAQNGELLPGATLLFTEIGKGAASNSYGFYSIVVPQGKYKIEISYVGYETKIEQVDLKSDTVFNWKLNAGVDLSEILVSSKRERLSSPVIGANYLSSQTINKIPVILGEQDVLKTLQTLPGVKGGNEGTSGIQVRGGSQDQNLILLDGVPVYNTNHLFGYLSTFNADVIKEVKFLKGSIPAKYGGRLSSVIDVAVKEGDLKKHHGKVSVSPVSGSFFMEGPLKKDTASYLLSVRRSWLDLPVYVWELVAENKEKFGYSFYDINAKANWIINDKNRLYLSHYQGRDGYFNNYNDTVYNSSYKFNWANYTSLLRWNCAVSPSFFVNTSVYYSQFQFNETTSVNKSTAYEESTKSKMADFSVKSDVDYSLEKNTLTFGWHFSSQLFMPEMMAYTNEELDTAFQVIAEDRVYSFAVYFEDEWHVTRNLILKPGLRGLYYNNGESKCYIEPKFASVYKLNESSSLKFSFQQMVQPIHLLTNTALNMPTDLWVPAIDSIQPATSWQYDLEYTKDINSVYSFQWNVYYKPMKNIIRYKQGISYATTTAVNWTEIVDVGKGLSYGTELMLEKGSGRLTGWVNYTLAWAWRKIDGINNNEYFPFKYDRRHVINVMLNYSLKHTDKKETEISAVFKFAAGNAITVPTQYYKGVGIPGLENLSDYYSSMINYQAFPYPNNYRMPAFHHLDIAYSSTKKLSNNRERVWKFSVYNVYNRLNPYFYVKRGSSYYQISLLPIIPSVTFSYKW